MCNSFINNILSKMGRWGFEPADATNNQVTNAAFVKKVSSCTLAHILERGTFSNYHIAHFSNPLFIKHRHRNYTKLLLL